MKGRGLVPFDDEMADPGAAITQKKAQQDEPEIARGNGRGQAEKAERAADKM